MTRWKKCVTALRGWALVFCCIGAGLANAAASDEAQTRYPIVLVHGAFGSDTLLGQDYFYGIPSALRARGAAVYVVRLSSINSMEVRGEQLLRQVRDVLALTGAPKVHLIGHSAGGPNARYVAGVAPQLVASVTSVGGSNRGLVVADFLAANAPSGSLASSAIYGTLQTLVQLNGLLSGQAPLPEDVYAGMMTQTTAAMAQFNARFPAGLPADCSQPNGPELVNGVRYFSWVGIAPVTNLLDPSDAALLTLSALQHEPTDGLAGACDSRLGRHLGDYQQNHLDEVNQLFGLRSLFSVNPVTLYVQHATRLKQLGL